MSIVVNFVGDRLRRVRMAAGLNGKDLAKQAGIAPAYLTQLEKGKRTPSSELLIKLASVLGVSVDAFHGEGRMSSDFGSVHEACGLFMPPTAEEFKAKIAKLEGQLERANETIASQARTIEAMQGRAVAAPVSGACGGGVYSEPVKRERKAEA